MTATAARRGSRIPVLEGLLPVNRAQIPAEILAGATLAALAIPEVMGYTKISGTPVITGLYTILVPMALFAVFGSSRHLVVGADSATAAILSAGLVGVAAVGSDEYVALAAVLALMAGAFLILARVVRLGFMADFLSRTVLIGFLTGVGIQVALGEVSGILGLERSGDGIAERIWNGLRQIDDANFYPMAISLVVLSLIDHTRRGYRPTNALVVPAESGTWHPEPVATGAQALPGLVIYRFTHSMYYANSQQLAEEVLGLVNRAHPPLKMFCIDASAVDDVDFTAAETLRSLHETLQAGNIRLAVTQVMPEVRTASRASLGDVFAGGVVYDTLEDVVRDFRARTQS